jgi:1-acylglycerone phosphate reductase
MAISQASKTVLITGCSDGGLGAALATEYHKAGYRVFATARTPSKMAALKASGIETLTLDVLSESSLSACVSEVQKLTGGTLNVLLNNAGAGYNMPISDMSITEAKRLFDLNVWSYIATIQAFLPLLLKARDGAMVVNQTSVASVIGLPFQSTYNASKAALAMFSECFRIEMQPFNIKVVDLRTGGVKSRFFENVKAAGYTALPKDSIYAAAREQIEKVFRGESLESEFVDQETWARQVVKDLTKSKPPYQIWRGGSALLCWVATFLPVGSMDWKVRQLFGMGIVIEQVKKERSLSKS